MMGGDYYETGVNLVMNEDLNRPNIGIGDGCVIDGAIIDKNARIGNGVIIRNMPDRPDSEEEHWVARDGLVIIKKSGVIPAGTVI